jgi:hypothetical protein
MHYKLIIDIFIVWRALYSSSQMTGRANLYNFFDFIADFFLLGVKENKQKIGIFEDQRSKCFVPSFTSPSGFKAEE